MKKKDPSIAIVSLILNVFIPGLGSLISRKIKAGVWQLSLFFGGFTIGLLLTILAAVNEVWSVLIISIPVMLLLPLAAWIWAIVTGARLIQENSN